MDKTTITQIAAGTALVCGSVDNAINSKRIRRLEKEAAKQRKRTAVISAATATSAVGVATTSFFVHKEAKKNKASFDEKCNAIQAQIDEVKKSLTQLSNDYSMAVRMGKLEITVNDRLNALGTALERFGNDLGNVKNVIYAKPPISK